MFRRLFALCILSIIMPLSCYATVNYTFDADHTYVLWRVSHLGYSELTGKIFASGTLQYNAQKPELSQAKLSFNIKTMSTGNLKLDRQLVGATYFDSEKFPVAIFETKNIKLTGKTTAEVRGLLTIKNATKPITIALKLLKKAEHPFFKRDTVGFKGTTKIKRSDYGINAYLPDVGDDVEIEIQAEAAELKH